MLRRTGENTEKDSQEDNIIGPIPRVELSSAKISLEWKDGMGISEKREIGGRIGEFSSSLTCVLGRFS